METSAPKRRKTSPTTSVPVDGSNSPASSDSAARRSSRLNPQVATSSPANAIFTRSFSEILQQRTSPRSQPDDDEALPDLPASEPGSPTSRQGSENDLVTAQLEHESETGNLQQDNRARNGKATVERPTSPVRRAGGGLAARPFRRTPTKPSPRPLPPPSEGEEEELINPFMGRRLRRSPPPGVLPPVEPEEPELPPTPTQKGISDPAAVITSPAGIHNTPSKRPKRSRALAAKLHSSPLKQPPLRPPGLELEPGPGLEAAGGEGGEAEGEGEVENSSSQLSRRESLRQEPRRKRRKRGPHPARRVDLDPLADKKALRDALLAEVAQLRDDLRVASRENERLHAAQGSRRGTIDLPDAREQGRLLDVLRRHALPPEKEEEEEEASPDPNRDWLEAAMNPMACLPFGHGTLPQLPPLVLPGEEAEEKEKGPPPVSHHPVSMTADEELPYLQVFTPLTFTSSITTLQQEPSGPDSDSEDPPPLLQRHAISVSSSPPGLFAATLDMVVNTRTLSIVDLTVPRLDPAAVPELGPFIEKILKGSTSAGDNSALTRNVTVVTWAMGEWVRLATRRARFWCALSRELGSKGRVVKCAERMRRRTTRRGRGSRDEGDEDDDDDDDEGGEGGKNKKDPSKADVIALMGRASLDLEIPADGAGNRGEDEDEEGGVTVRVNWKVDFDWTGEARSQIGILLRAPAKWHARDEKKSLAGLPAMFDTLLAQRKDPLEAVKVVVALIVGDGPPS